MREKTELTLRSLAKDGDTWSYAFAQSIPDDEEVTLNFTNVTVTKDGDEWIASGFTLSGADKKYYTLATERMAFVPADSDLVTVTVDGSVIGKYYRGTEVVVTAPAKDGYNFDGWYRDGAAVCTDAVYTFTAQSDVALTTQYTQKAPAPAPEQNGGNANAVLVLALACRNNQKCVVTYKSTGAVDHVTIAVKKGTTIAPPAVPQKDGYTFVGWYKDINGTKPFDFTAKITRSVSIYAKWVKN